ncbi:MAG TPA: glycogen/starch synthase, partial [Spirochaetota bacterium]|nr:glycogen/starch synthase [Spirochaetota bacterium]
PFEDDAKRFAFFSKCVCELLLNFEEFKEINVLHNHDWHTGVILILLNLCEQYKTINQKFRKIFTIHNLDYQGVRPFYDTQYNELTSFESWFPDLYKRISKTKLYSLIKAPKIFYPCFNPMRAGINLSDFVNTVSPSYSKEITEKDDISKNFFGGRGLEGDLKKIFKKGKLLGILNGIDYEENNPRKLNPPIDWDIPNGLENKQVHKKDLISNLPTYLENIYNKQKDKFVNWDSISDKLKDYNKDKFIDLPLYVTVSRVVTQKLGILLEKYDKSIVIDQIKNKKMLFILIGTGELQEKLEFLNNFENVFYIAAYDTNFADRLYHSGDFFLMPSYFEPCGISQLISLRYGTLPIVNNIGGLKDTVTHMETGFVFDGKNKDAIKKSFIKSITDTIDIFNTDKQKIIEMQQNAMKKRFDWESAIKEYIRIYSL